ncbi:hypothetical protein ACFL5N_00975 [bacterium]
MKIFLKLFKGRLIITLFLLFTFAVNIFAYSVPSAGFMLNGKRGGNVSNSSTFEYGNFGQRNSNKLIFGISLEMVYETTRMSKEIFISIASVLKSMRIAKEKGLGKKAKDVQNKKESQKDNLEYTISDGGSNNLLKQNRDFKCKMFDFKTNKIFVFVILVNCSLSFVRPIRIFTWLRDKGTHNDDENSSAINNKNNIFRSERAFEQQNIESCLNAFFYLLKKITFVIL